MPNQERSLWTMLTVIALIFIGNQWLDYAFESTQSEDALKGYAFDDGDLSECLSARSSYTYKFPYTDSETERLIAADINLERAFSYSERGTSPIPGINDYIFVQKKPKPLNYDYVKERIGYPRIAQNAGIEGEVLARILVDERGNYIKHWVINDLHLHPLLKMACEQHLKELHFSPAVQCGKSVKYWVNVPFTFYMVK